MNENERKVGEPNGPECIRCKKNFFSKGQYLTEFVRM